VNIALRTQGALSNSWTVFRFIAAKVENKSKIGKKLSLADRSSRRETGLQFPPKLKSECALLSNIETERWVRLPVMPLSMHRTPDFGSINGQPS
jgi:hypothetical protein